MAHLHGHLFSHVCNENWPGERIGCLPCIEFMFKDFLLEPFSGGISKKVNHIEGSFDHEHPQNVVCCWEFVWELTEKREVFWRFDDLVKWPMWCHFVHAVLLWWLWLAWLTQSSILTALGQQIGASEYINLTDVYYLVSALGYSISILGTYHLCISFLVYLFTPLAKSSHLLSEAEMYVTFVYLFYPLLTLSCSLFLRYIILNRSPFWSWDFIS